MCYFGSVNAQTLIYMHLYNILFIEGPRESYLRETGSFRGREMLSSTKKKQSVACGLYFENRSRKSACQIFLKRVSPSRGIICLRQSQRWIHDKSTNEHQWLCGNSPAADQTCGFLTHTGEFGQAEACRRMAGEFNFLTFQHAADGSVCNSNGWDETNSSGFLDVLMQHWFRCFGSACSYLLVIISH